MINEVTEAQPQKNTEVKTQVNAITLLKRLYLLIAKAFTEYTLVFIMVIVILFAIIYSSDFFTRENIKNLIDKISILELIAFGQTLVIIGGGIDLSVGSVLALSSIIVGLIGPFDWVIAIVVAILAATVCGLINGVIVTKMKIPAFIVTLSMMGIARGVALTLNNGNSVGGIDTHIRFIGLGSIGFIPISVIIWVGIGIFLVVLLSKSYWGRYNYAVGGNEDAAYLSGIKTDRIRIFSYGFTGFLCAIAGIIMTGRMGLGSPVSGYGLEMDSIAAVVIGGTNLFGGYGTIQGTVVGVAILGIIDGLLTQMGISPFWQGIVKGALLLIIVSVSVRRGRVTSSKAIRNA